MVNFQNVINDNNEIKIYGAKSTVILNWPLAMSYFTLELYFSSYSYNASFILIFFHIYFIYKYIFIVYMKETQYYIFKEHFSISFWFVILLLKTYKYIQPILNAADCTATTNLLKSYNTWNLLLNPNPSSISKNAFSQSYYLTITVHRNIFF